MRLNRQSMLKQVFCTKVPCNKSDIDPQTYLECRSIKISLLFPWLPLASVFYRLSNPFSVGSQDLPLYHTEI